MDRHGVGLNADDERASQSPLALAARVATTPFVVLAVVHLTVLAWRLPLFDRLPGWVFSTHAKPIGVGAWMLLAAVPLVSMSAAFVMRRSRVLVLLCLIVGGYAFQHVLAWSEGRGLDGMRERIVRSGHAEFADVAVAQRSLWSVATHYEVKVRGGELARYAHSKPPGTLLVYMATDRVARLFVHDRSPEARRASLDTTAALVWPLFCYLTLLPLHAVVRRWCGDDAAFLACASYIVVPSVSLMTLHTDQFLFPLLGMSAIWAGVIAAERRRAWMAFATGLWIWTIGFFTFPLLLLAPVIAGAAWTETGRAVADMRQRFTATVRLVAWMVAGVLAGFVLFRLALGYDVFARFADARQFNVAWKGWEGGAFQTFYFAWMNLLEFMLWVGMPIALLGFARVGRAVREAAAGEWRGAVVPALITILVVGYLAFAGQSKGETARLWLFTVPLLTAFAADELLTVWSSAPGWATGVLLVLQWLTVVLTKTGQDFY
ncbi:MAG: hypothetical protein QM736_21875 [Vicinamibacterales bacterium]